MRAVKFLMSGAAYGYGYSAGEIGSVKAEDFERLEKAGIVSAITAPHEKTEKATPNTKPENR